MITIDVLSTIKQLANESGETWESYIENLNTEIDALPVLRFKCERRPRYLLRLLTFDFDCRDWTELLVCHSDECVNWLLIQLVRVDVERSFSDELTSRRS